MILSFDLAFCCVRCCWLFGITVDQFVFYFTYCRYSYGVPNENSFNNLMPHSDPTGDMRDRITVIGLYHSNDTMSFALIMDTAQDSSGGELDLVLRSPLWTSNDFPKAVIDNSAEDFFYDKGAGNVR